MDDTVLALTDRTLVQRFQFLTASRDSALQARKIETLSGDKIYANDIVLFKIEEITFEEDAPRQEALENVFASLRLIPGINFLYMILGDKKGVNFYFGLSREFSKKSDVNVLNLGNSLKSSLEGNFRGSIVKKVEETEKRRIIDQMTPPSDKKYYATLEGVPGINTDETKKNFQGVDRLVDVMLGDEFGFAVIAHPIHMDEEMLAIENDLYAIYDTVSFAAKQSVQYGSNQGEQEGSSRTTGKGSSSSEGYSDTETASRGRSDGTNYTEGTNQGTSHTKGTNEGTNYSEGTNQGTSHNKGTNEGTNYSEGTTKGTNSSRGTSDSKNSGNSQDSGSSSTNSSTSRGTSENAGESSGTSKTSGTSKGTSETAGYSSGTSKTSGTSKGTSETAGDSSGTSETRGEQHGTNSGESKSKGHNVSYSDSNNESFTANEGRQTGSSMTVSLDVARKNMQEWMKYLDEVLLPRFDYGHGKGLFVVSPLLWADNERVLNKLVNTATGLFAGEKGNRIPLRVTPLDHENNYLNALRLFQQPLSKDTFPVNTDEWKKEILWSHTYTPDGADSNAGRFYLGNWMSVKELAVMAGIPQKEVVGLRLKEEVEFGLNVRSAGSKEDAKEINLGQLVVSGSIKNIDVNILSSDLDRHIFVTGVTGAGKTTTCQKLLIDSGLPFLIIEPAKTEYRILLNEFPEMEIFTLGSNTAPLRLNPFHFIEGENISSRVDMIKASIEAAFDMEAAIPQIIEQTIYDTYTEKGWNINTNRNADFEDPWAPDTNAFPTMSDVLQKVEHAVAKHGFDERLKKDYIGSIKARLQGLTLGAKGMMLDCGRSVDFDDLLDKRVILELEELRNGGEKSLVIGFVMINLLEAIRRRFEKNGGRKHLHITLIEEAHRLLAKPQAGDANRRHGVETFTDMLAEIRKYGESLIIADQIPNKLTPEVLKNTNTKIVHRLFAQDDKDAIGNTMALSEEQRNFLSNLPVGRAVVFNGNWPKAVQVQMKQSTDTSKSGEGTLDSAFLKERNLRFYSRQWKKGVIDGAAVLEREPSPEEMELFMRIAGNNTDYPKALAELKERKDKNLLKPLTDLLKTVSDQETLAKVLAAKYLHDASAGKDILKALDCYPAGRPCPAGLSLRVRNINK